MLQHNMKTAKPSRVWERQAWDRSEREMERFPYRSLVEIVRAILHDNIAVMGIRKCDKAESSARIKELQTRARASA
jgi:hypothetical protein